MNLIRFLSYPVFYDPASPRAAAYVMEHFYRIRSNTRGRRLLKLLVRPALPFLRRQRSELLIKHPRFGRLQPFLKGRKYEVVIDGRRFFRLIDFDRREVLNIFKDADPPVFFENEVSARQRLAGSDFIPRLISVDESSRKFTDEYVCERPFKAGSLRDLDPVKFAFRLKNIIHQIRGCAPVRPVEAGEYVSALIKELQARPETDGEIRRYLDEAGTAAARLGQIDLVFSHGDFRKDQIFFSAGGDIKIIDWECSGYFSRCFDLLEFFITEKWLYADPAVGLAELLEVEHSRMMDLCYLYLLELYHYPIRFQGGFLLPCSLPIVKQVEQRIRRRVFVGR